MIIYYFILSSHVIYEFYLEMSKYIICGSSGFIVRNLAEMLIKENIATFVRLVDKRCPAIAKMTEA